MNIQVIGTKKCKETQKAERFFKERRINYQFRDLTEKGLSKGELDNIMNVFSEDELIDPQSKEYQKRGLAYMVYNKVNEILENPLVLKTPIVRNGRKVTLGYDPEKWTEWIRSES